MICETVAARGFALRVSVYTKKSTEFRYPTIVVKDADIYSAIS